jgi:hypothetical protein
MLGNQCERDENTFRIYGNNKNSEDPTLPTIPKGKKIGPLVHDGSPYWPPRISMPIFVIYHFGPRLMAGTPTVRIKPNFHGHAISLGQNGKEHW